MLTEKIKPTEKQNEITYRIMYKLYRRVKKKKHIGHYFYVI